MVIRIGASDVGPSVSQLVKDVRSMMEPATATKLKERKSNSLRDYTSMAGPLGVSHLLLFSRSDNGNVQLRMAVTPRGPTLCFRVEKYSLCKDVHKSMKRPKTSGNEYLSSPLLVMNNFSSAQGETEETKGKKNIPKHLESLTTTIFQSLFPPINPTTTPLKSIKRIMLLDRAPHDANTENPSYVLNLRHYAIETRTAKSVPKALRKLDAAEKLRSQGGKRNRGGLPNLGKLDDVADYLLDPQEDGFTSGSDSEPETDAEVEILEDDTRRVMSKAQHKKRQEDLSDRRDPTRKVERRGIKMHELGPRMRLRLTKVEEGLCTGKVMWHEYIHKSPEELKEMDRVHAKRRQEKEKRKAEQKANVEKKKAEKAARKASGKPDAEDDDDDEIIGDPYDSDEDQWQDDDMENVEDEDEDEEMEDEEEE